MQNAHEKSNLTLEILDDLSQNPNGAVNLDTDDLLEIQSQIKSSADYTKLRTLQFQDVLSTLFSSHAEEARKVKNTIGQVSWNDSKNPQVSVSASSPTAIKWDSKAMLKVVSNIDDKAMEFLQQLNKCGVTVKIEVSETNWTKLKASDEPLAKAVRGFLEPHRTITEKTPSYKLTVKDLK
jgi:hypothetical protein|tara:strand:- start:296 stop:835 length:540 start_codon:yes stop_codon:yes gene_type:complete